MVSLVLVREIHTCVCACVLVDGRDIVRVVNDPNQTRKESYSPVHTKQQAPRGMDGLPFMVRESVKQEAFQAFGPLKRLTALNCGVNPRESLQGRGLEYSKRGNDWKVGFSCSSRRSCSWDDSPNVKKMDYREQTLLYKKTIVTRVYTCVTNAYPCVNF